MAKKKVVLFENAAIKKISDIQVVDDKKTTKIHVTAVLTAPVARALGCYRSLFHEKAVTTGTRGRAKEKVIERISEAEQGIDDTKIRYEMAAADVIVTPQGMPNNQIQFHVTAARNFFTWLGEKGVRLCRFDLVMSQDPVMIVNHYWTVGQATGKIELRLSAEQIEISEAGDDEKPKRRRGRPPKGAAAAGDDPRQTTIAEQAALGETGEITGSPNGAGPFPLANAEGVYDVTAAERVFDTKLSGAIATVYVLQIAPQRWVYGFETKFGHDTKIGLLSDGSAQMADREAAARAGLGIVRNYFAGHDSPAVSPHARKNGDKLIARLDARLTVGAGQPE